MTEDESKTWPSRAGENDMAARAVMIDALEEMGSHKTAAVTRVTGSLR